MSYEAFNPESFGPSPLEALVERLTPYAHETDMTHHVEYLSNIEGLSQSDWSELNEAGKLNKLNELEVRLAEIQGRSPRLVVARSYPEGLTTLGHYNDTIRDVININEELIKTPGHRIEALNTVAHEGRHAFQHDAIRGLVYYDPEIVAYWRANADHYLPASKFGFQIYESQPLELDANSFADRIVHEIDSGSSRLGYDSHESTGFATSESIDEQVAWQFGPAARAYMG